MGCNVATVYIPSPLRRLTGGQGKVSVRGAHVRTLLEVLERQFPGMRQQLCEENGEVRSFINIFVNGTEIRQLEALETRVNDTDEVSIIPAMAGGQTTRGDSGFGIRDWRKGSIPIP